MPGGGRITVLAPPTLAFRAGEAVTVEFPADRLMGLVNEAAPSTP